MIYLYLYGLSFISSIVQFARQKEIRLLLGFILIVSIGFVVSFRFESVDYYSYQRIYDGLEWDFSKFSFFIYDLNHSTPIETGFAVFNLIVKSTFDSFYFFIALFSIVSLTIKYTAFKKCLHISCYQFYCTFLMSIFGRIWGKLEMPWLQVLYCGLYILHLSIDFFCSLF